MDKELRQLLIEKMGPQPANVTEHVLEMVARTLTPEKAAVLKEGLIKEKEKKQNSTVLTLTEHMY